MNIVLNFIKTNVITVVSIVVALVGVGLFCFVMFVKDPALNETMNSGNRPYQDVDKFLKGSVSVPASNPDDPPKSISTVITPRVTQAIEQVYGQLASEYEKVKQQAVTFNQKTDEGGHPLIHNGLFPERANQAVGFEAEQSYQEALLSLFGPALDEQEFAKLSQEKPLLAALPRLNAGTPPPAQDIEMAIATVDANFSEIVNPTEADEIRMRDEKQQKLIQTLVDRAYTIHIYADGDIRSPNFPLTVTSLRSTASTANISTLATQSVFWEAQMELWVQSDVIRAIAKANDINNPEKNVLVNPIKRLVGLQVVPGYVGVHGQGAFGAESAANRPGGGFGAQAAGGFAGGTVFPATGSRTNDLNEAPKFNFSAGPTGRVSNALYDVRHVRLTAVVDWKQMPAIYEAVNSTNFMTVLQVNFSGVDEYQALQEGYVYGQGDAVQVEMLIETIWMRSWTTPFMPKSVRESIGLDESAAAGNQAGGFGGRGF